MSQSNNNNNNSVNYPANAFYSVQYPMPMPNMALPGVNRSPQAPQPYFNSSQQAAYPLQQPFAQPILYAQPLVAPGQQMAMSSAMALHYSREENSTAEQHSDPAAKEPEADANGKRAAPIDYKPRVAGQWIEYKTEDGLPYYYDAIAKKTQWEMPDEFEAPQTVKKAKLNNAAASKTSAVFEKFSVGRPSAEAKQKGDEPAQNGADKPAGSSAEIKVATADHSEASCFSTFDLLSHEECVAMFEALLREQDIPHDAEWAGVLSDIIKDSRYSAIKTLGERKKIFAAYCAQRKKDLERKRKEEAEQKTAAFHAMLKESGKVELSTKFSEIEKMFGDDERFTALKYIEKRDLFSKFRDALKKELREREKQLFAANAPLFAQLLRESDKVGPKSDWEQVKEHFVQAECVKNLKAMERLSVFRKHVAELTARLRREQEELRETHKAQEKAFRRLLYETALKKTLFHAKSRWSELLRLERIVGDERYRCLAQDKTRRDVPRKLFERFCCDLEDKLASGKSQLKKFLRAKLRRVGVDDTAEQLMAQYGGEDSFPKIKAEHAKVLFLEMVAKAQYKHQRKMP